ncbi:MAG: DUF1361 domain-containing protein [Leuconostoc gelidum]
MRDKVLNITIVHVMVFLFFVFVYVTPTHFTFLNWNVFLSLLPFDFAVIVATTHFKMIKSVFLVLWLLFFPNTMYMMTDFIHLYAIGTNLNQATQYFNYAILATGIFIGVGLGILSLEIVTHAIFKQHVHVVYFSVTAVVSVVSAFGIYLGRYMRLNSWDVFTQFSTVVDNVLSSVGYHMITFVILFSGAQFAILVIYHYGLRLIKISDTQA